MLEALPPCPTTMVPIPVAAGGKLQEEIGVVLLVSNAALVLNYLNGPLTPPPSTHTHALTLGDLGLSLYSLFQSEVSVSDEILLK